jgi:hypothetical protein
MHHVRLALVLVLGMIVGSALLPPPSVSAQGGGCTGSTDVSAICCEATLTAAVQAGLLRAQEKDSLVAACHAGEPQVRELRATLGGWLDALQQNPTAAGLCDPPLVRRRTEPPAVPTERRVVGPWGAARLARRGTLAGRARARQALLSVPRIRRVGASHTAYCVHSASALLYR